MYLKYNSGLHAFAELRAFAEFISHNIAEIYSIMGWGYVNGFRL